jgi:hypothetical protein
MVAGCLSTARALAERLPTRLPTGCRVCRRLPGTPRGVVQPIGRRSARRMPLPLYPDIARLLTGHASERATTRRGSTWPGTAIRVSPRNRVREARPSRCLHLISRLVVGFRYRSGQARSRRRGVGPRSLIAVDQAGSIRTSGSTQPPIAIEHASVAFEQWLLDEPPGNGGAAGRRIGEILISEMRRRLSRCVCCPRLSWHAPGKAALQQDRVPSQWPQQER